MHRYSPRPGYRALPRNADRRVSIRREAGIETDCALAHRAGGALEWLVEVMDISTGGIGLILDQFLPLGSRLDVVLSNGPHAAHHAIDVVHSAKLGNGVWFAGCQFTEPLDAAALAAWA